MKLSPDNYIGPSGIHMEELKEIQNVLVIDEKEMGEEDKKNK